MVGYSTRTNPTTGVSVKRYWHFAMQARPLVHPAPAFVFKPHVVFTNDGLTIWESKETAGVGPAQSVQNLVERRVARPHAGRGDTLAWGYSTEIKMNLGSEASLTV